MSKQALDGFRAKVTEDQTLREEMMRVLGKGPGQSRATVDELVIFAKAHGYEFSAEDVRDNLELSDKRLDAVTGGAIYMNYANVKAEVTDSKHKGWIELNSISF